MSVCDCWPGDSCEVCRAAKKSKKMVLKPLAMALKEKLAAPSLVAGVSPGANGTLTVYIKAGTVIARPSAREGKVKGLRIVGKPDKKVKRGTPVQLILPERFEDHTVAFREDIHKKI